MISNDSAWRPIVLQLARYRFHWTVVSPLQLPPYASSTLRGVFGRVLRQQTCLTGLAECRGCAMLTTCPYPRLFEPQVVPRPSDSPPALAPYSIETPFLDSGPYHAKGWRYRPGDRYMFDMVLMTPDGLRHLELIIAAWRKAFMLGVGTLRGRAELMRVEHLVPERSASIVFRTGNDARLQRHDVDVSVPGFSQACDVELSFQTPLRIEHKGRLIRDREISPSLFLRHLIRRVSFQLEAQQANGFSLDDIHRFNALADHVSEGHRDLIWKDWSRYSSRQKQKMKFGGLVGHWQLLQVPPELLPFIYFGQWLHVGKESSFGLGKYIWIQASHQNEKLTPDQ